MEPTVVKLDMLTNIAILVMAAANILLFAGLAILAFKLKSIVTGTVNEVLEKTLPKVQPTLDHVSDITAKVSDLVEKVSPKVVHIADESEGTVHNVTEKVKTTSSIVTENVAKPIVNIASLLTGVQRGLEVWKTAKETNDGHGSHNGDGREHVTVAEEAVVVTPEAR